MRSMFPGYYSPSSDDFSKIWDEGIFIFDTNVLLDLYRYSDETAESLISTMEKIKGRIWIPYRIAFEYHRRLNDIIKGQAIEYNSAIESLTSFNKKFQEKRSHPFLTKALHKEIDDFCNRFETELRDKQKQIKQLILSNPTKDRLADIIDKAIGKQFTASELEAIYTEGVKRYAEKIPPGYKDKSQKQGNEVYGDLIIWKEICLKAKESNLPIIFITSDVKEDWFQIVLGMTVGPRPELVAEIKKYNDILFHIYPTDIFLRHAQERLEVVVKENAITEIEEGISEYRKVEESDGSIEDSITQDSIEYISERDQNLFTDTNSKSIDSSDENTGEFEP